MFYYIFVVVVQKTPYGYEVNIHSSNALTYQPTEKGEKLPIFRCASQLPDYFFPHLFDMLMFKDV